MSTAPATDPAWPLALPTQRGVCAAWASYGLVEHPTSHRRVSPADVPSRKLGLERTRAL